MNRPRFHISFLVFIALLIPIFGFSPAMRAQPASAPAEGPSEVKKQPAPRVKPQVIYHVPRVSGNAAALHAQAKADNNALPIDGNMPVSLQMARSAANAEAAQSSPTPPNNPEQNRVVPRVARPSREKAQKGNSRSIAPRQAPRDRAAGAGNRGGAGHGKKQKK
jgi:hypothetical protein